jgi:hypothetical protein
LVKSFFPVRKVGGHEKLGERALEHHFSRRGHGRREQSHGKKCALHGLKLSTLARGMRGAYRQSAGALSLGAGKIRPAIVLVRGLDGVES